MDQTTGHVKAESQQPENQQNYKNGPKHSFSSQAQWQLTCAGGDSLSGACCNATDNGCIFSWGYPVREYLYLAPQLTTPSSDIHACTIVWFSFRSRRGSWEPRYGLADVPVLQR